MPTQRSGKGRGNASPPAKDRPVKVVRVQKCQGQYLGQSSRRWAQECEGEFSCTTHNYSHFYKTDSLAGGAQRTLKECHAATSTRCALAL